jgi:hypothetical protein
MSKPKKITFLEDISNKTDDIQNLKLPTTLEISTLYDNIFDLSLPEDYRLNNLKEYVDRLSDETPNIINKLNSMFLYSYSKIIENYLFAICLKTSIDIFLRLECAKCLSYNSEKGYIALNELCSLFEQYPNLTTTLKIDAVCRLMINKKYKKESLRYFEIIINDNNIEPLFRYKTIQSLEFKLEVENDKKYFTKKACVVYLDNLKNPVTYRILAGQYLLRKCDVDLDMRDWIEKYLLSFAKDETLSINVRADAVDVLLQLGEKEVRKEAAELILILGAVGGIVRTVFDNSQNVHHKSIEDSANKILEFLNSVRSVNEEGKEIDFDYVRKEILDLVKEKEPKFDEKENYKSYKEKIEAALTRIFIDRAVYSRYNMSLMMILIKIWTYIQNHQYSEEMKRRVLEELYDSSDVCSTGYAFRILNVISGFGELSIGISFEDQVVGNLAAKLNNKIREIQNEDFKIEVITEMSIDPSDFKSRTNFLKFFRESISKIREDMYQDFKEYMSDTDYDMYFRKAIIHYEGCN